MGGKAELGTGRQDHNVSRAELLPVDANGRSGDLDVQSPAISMHTATRQKSTAFLHKLKS